MDRLTFWYLFGAYGVVWLLVFAYVQNLRTRQRQLEAELEALRQSGGDGDGA